MPDALLQPGGSAAATTRGAIDAIRDWLRSDMRTLRWVLLTLYLLLIGSLLGVALFDDDLIHVLIWPGVLLGAQALFILGGGTIQLCRPIRKRRLLMPVIVASFMFTLLMFGATAALVELFDAEHFLDSVIAWVLLAASWVGWGVLLFLHTRPMPRFAALSRLAKLMFAGSLAELLAAVPSHVIVSRRPGCLVGMYTMMGIVAGLSVMFFSFGPMIVLLFLRPRYRRERMEGLAGIRYCEICGYDLRATPTRCPECGTPVRASSGTAATVS